MRADLNKLLCERERVRSRERFRPYRRKKTFCPPMGEEGENLPCREGMQFRYGYDRKTFNENLTPLKGAIRKAVGRRWESFFSELASNFPMHTVINKHILQHLYQYVEVDVLEHNNGLFVRSDYRGMIPLAQSWAPFYVDPRTRIIRRNKFYTTAKQIARRHRQEQEAKTARTYRQVDDNTVLGKVGDTWFIYDLKPIPKDAKVMDTFRGELVTETRWGKNVYHTNRRTASHKYLKRHGLIGT